MAPRWATHGRGGPVTLVVHGLGATEGEARIPASGLPGTRVVVMLPGHGEAPDAPSGYWNYSSIAADVLAVADEVGATRAVGVSMGSGALTRIAAEHPDRFERLALLLPAALDRPRSIAANWSFERLADAVAAGDGAQLRKLVAEDLPPGAELGDYVEQRAHALLRLEDALRELPEQAPLADASALSSANSDVLVVGATDDPLHPAEVAKSVAAAFARARLEIFPSPAPMLTHRRELRRLLVDFLA
ncbi:alpha/beta hydrolase [Saccharopolyspora sp. WRP15-2]|uniref:Alpha/beta hydrolase n=1 Tax=Saccharopolyspora oryzae TaxID=2997343 RepID=A0ABT4V1Z2_9PSEU|nr:alpha/beta hydrolase [Saccharopolyspora oryzae]MDA3627466.1 alpha/beta hydrolase [Saccharopolyspora oryzae]